LRRRPPSETGLPAGGRGKLASGAAQGDDDDDQDDQDAKISRGRENETRIFFFFFNSIFHDAWKTVFYTPYTYYIFYIRNNIIYYVCILCTLHTLHISHGRPITQIYIYIYIVIHLKYYIMTWPALYLPPTIGLELILIASAWTIFFLLLYLKNTRLRSKDKLLQPPVVCYDHAQPVRYHTAAGTKRAV